MLRVRTSIKIIELNVPLFVNHLITKYTRLWLVDMSKTTELKAKLKEDQLTNNF